MDILAELKSRNLPELPQNREEILQILQREEYGFLPQAPLSLRFEERNVIKKDFAAGKASLKEITAYCTLPGGELSFPFYAVVPASRGPHPAFVLINFSHDVPDKYYPAEEIVDGGYAVFSFGYQDVTSDNGNMYDHFAAALRKNDGSSDDPGKIAIWAWAAMRVMDYVQTREDIDHEHVAVIGHSRLGKTALFAGAMDERFALTISNDSGCGGAAISRGKVGESIEAITNRFPFWFCKNYSKYAEKEDMQPFDQHFLLAAIAPRALYVASAQEDDWADPTSEFLSCVAVSPVFERFGEGFVHEGKIPETGQLLHEGKIAYHRRAGSHYLSREDWKYYMAYFDSIRK